MLKKLFPIAIELFRMLVQSQRYSRWQWLQRQTTPFWLLLLLMFPALVQAQFVYVTNSGKLTITGYRGAGGDVAIPSAIQGLPVTAIGPSAFEYCYGLTNVSIPNSVTSIGGYGFRSCTNLASIVIPDSVTDIGSYAFSQCTSLSSIAIPDNVTRIESYVFASCSSLSRVVLPSRVEEIRDGAFQACGLTNVTFPNTVWLIGFFAFQSCSSLTSVTIPMSNMLIAGYAFASCPKLAGVYCQGNAPTADATAFSGSTNATVYYMPGTASWTSTFGGRPTAPWALPYPVALETRPSFGVNANKFGFLISWASNATVIVEACTDVATPTWAAVSTNALVNGRIYFSDPRWTNHQARFYRLRSR